jgi:hypothetical protein
VGVYSASMTLLPFSFSHLSHKLASPVEPWSPRQSWKTMVISH